MANSSRSIYIRYTMARLAEAGFQAVAMNYRAVEHLEITSPHIGCADTWKDLPEVLDVIEAECPAQPIFAMGFSMGGTILTKYLGENGQQSRLRAAVAVSCPLAYPAHQAELEKRKFLSFLMAQPLKLWLFKKREQIAKLWPHCEMSQVMMSGSLLTHQGYHTVSDYFLQNDPEPVLQRIACPLLILGAKDDPLMMPVPRETIAQNKHLILVETEDGGHMGWAGKGTLGPQIFGSSWADGLAARFLAFHAKMPLTLWGCSRFCSDQARWRLSLKSTVLLMSVWATPKSWPQTWGEAATDSLNSLVFPGLDFSGLVFGQPPFSDLKLDDSTSFPVDFWTPNSLSVGLPTSAFKEAQKLQFMQDDALSSEKETSKDLLKRQLQKTQLCMFWKRNCCAKGSDCTFAHSVEELKELPDLRRTSLCKQWLKGRCPLSASTCEAYLRRTFEDGRRRQKGRLANGLGDA
eukprot:g27091.t1